VGKKRIFGIIKLKIRYTLNSNTSISVSLLKHNMTTVDFNTKVFSNTKNIEQFQNLTIRPLIKENHNIIMTLFNDICKSTHLNLKGKDIITKQTAINTLFSKNIPFVNQLIGIVIAGFTIDELKTYIADSKEYNKRIKQIVKERIMSQI
jgi:hypothetical protein